jgi:hypothetical protein
MVATGFPTYVTMTWSANDEGEDTAMTNYLKADQEEY